MPAFNWWSDEICRREDELSPVWHFVHYDREQFQWLLKEMGLEPEQREDADPTSRTGVQGAPAFHTSFRSGSGEPDECGTAS